MWSAVRCWHHRPVPETRPSITTVLARPIAFGLVLPIILVVIDPWRRQSETPSLVIGTIVTVSGLAMLAGLSMASRSPILGVYLLGAAAGLHLWVVRREEPSWADRFGQRWEQYQATVPRWLPRLLALPARH